MKGAICISKEGPKKLNPAVSQEEAILGVVRLEEGSGVPSSSCACSKEQQRRWLLAMLLKRVVELWCLVPSINLGVQVQIEQGGYSKGLWDMTGWCQVLEGEPCTTFW